MGGEFSIPDQMERVNWIEGLIHDGTFKQMLTRFGVEADDEFFHSLLDEVEYE
jgi:hypothetical protein